MSFDPDGGGSGDRYGQLLVTPTGPVDYGSVVDGNTVTLTFTARNTGNGSLTLTAIALTDVSVWTLVHGSLPHILSPQTQTTFTVKFAPVGVTAYSTSLEVSWTDAGGEQDPYEAILSGTGIAGGTHQGQFDPSTLSFDTTVVGGTRSIAVQLKNVGSGSFDLLSENFTDGTDYTDASTVVYPLTLAPGAHQTYLIQFLPTETGFLTDAFNVVTDTAGTVSLPIQGVSVLLISIDICTENIRGVVVGGIDALGVQGKPAPQKLFPLNLNSNQAGTVVFNGAIWQGLGMEKTMTKLAFYYENYGVANFTITLRVFRPQQGADAVQTYIYPGTLGTVTADQSYRYAEIDTFATGEMIFMTLTRVANSGPLCIDIINPIFEQRGEKVRDV